MDVPARWALLDQRAQDLCSPMQVSLESYATMHREIISGARPRKVLLWTQEDGRFDGTHGVGNEALIFETVLLMGMLSKRAVFFDLAKPWSRLLKSRHFNWDWRAVRRQNKWAARVNASNPRLWRLIPRGLDLSELDLQRFFDRDLEILPHQETVQRMEIMAGVDIFYRNPVYPMLPNWFITSYILRGCLWYALFGDLSPRLLAALGRRLERLGPARGGNVLGVHFSTGTNEVRYLERKRADCRARYAPPCRCLYDTKALYNTDWETEEEQDLCHIHDWNARASEGKLVNYFALLDFFPQCLDGMIKTELNERVEVVFLLSNDKPREDVLASRIKWYFARARVNVSLARLSDENVVTRTDVDTLESALADNLLLACADIVVDAQAESTFVNVAGHIGLRGWRFHGDGLGSMHWGARVFEAFRTCENHVSEWPPVLANGVPVYTTAGF